MSSYITCVICRYSFCTEDCLFSVLGFLAKAEFLEGDLREYYFVLGDRFLSGRMMSDVGNVFHYKD